jgi:hypothetical protein
LRELIVIYVVKEKLSLISIRRARKIHISEIDFDKLNSYFSVKFCTMNLQAEKLNILQAIMSTNDEGLIMDVKAFLSDRKTDWFDELSEEQQKDVLEGLAEADRGETIPHSEVVKLFGKWGLK